MSAPDQEVVLPALVDTLEKAVQDLQIEATVLACDLLELARITAARLKETTISASDLQVLHDGLGEVERTLSMTRVALEVAAQAAKL